MIKILASLLWMNFVLAGNHVDLVTKLFKDSFEVDRLQCGITNGEIDLTSHFSQDSQEIKKFNCDMIPDGQNQDVLFWYMRKNLCTSKYGQNNSTCTVLDQSLIEKRRNNLDLMKRIQRYTENQFRIYRDELALKCCQGKSSCLPRFQKTSLELVNDEKAIAEYQSSQLVNDPGRIVISNTKLAANLNEENVDRLLLHELGHACQFARIAEDEKRYSSFTDPEKNCSNEETGLYEFREFLGEKMTFCLQKKITIMKHKLESTGGFCFHRWYRETFADMAFRDQMKTPLHWTFDTNRKSSSKNHPGTANLLECYESEKIKQQLCN